MLVVWNAFTQQICHNMTFTNLNPSSYTGTREYCPSEYFNATCGRGQVILMRLARYGRMSPGRCVTGNHGYLGCSDDVTDYMHRKCSGKPKCLVYIAEPKLHALKPCPKDFASYLEAAYDCLDGKYSRLSIVIYLITYLKMNCCTS